MNARTRTATVAALVAAGVLVVLALVRAAPGDTTPTTPEATTVTVTTPDPDVPRLQRKLHAQARRLSAYSHRTRGLIRTLHHQGSVAEALTLACTTYGACTTLRRRSWCESRNDPQAYNSSGASGLFQFLPGTWRSTPYGASSVWSPYANALAAGWMIEHGRGGEWSCR